MRVKCDYCDNYIDDTLENCPYCGAQNLYVRKRGENPRTIQEFKEWYVSHKLPPYEITRFFIGINYTKPKAFGIYQDEEDKFVVYKNKLDGSRSIRYRGFDEAYAVNELFQRLKAEIAGRNSRIK